MRPMRLPRRPPRAVELLLAVVLIVALSPTMASAAAPRDSLAGLEPCPAYGGGALCGDVQRAWDPTGAVPGTLGIGFVLWPARDTSQPALGTIVAQEGGPGYAATASASYYLELFAPLLDRRNLLIVDQRGTGRSEPIDCPELQDLQRRYAVAAAICGARLGDHAHLYGTDLAADDLAAVIETLSVGPVDFYGDSYGTFFGQVFAGRHGDLLRTLTLDAAYPTYGEDAWYDTQAPALRDSLSTVCADSLWCAQQDGSTLVRLAEVVTRLRSSPVSGVAPGADGRRHLVRLDAAKLAAVAYGGTYVSTTYREFDAALRAAQGGDWLPLLRLKAEFDYPGGGLDVPRDYSEGLDAAVSCRDYPQVVDLMSPPASRPQQLATAIAVKQRIDPPVYAPWTVREQVDSEWTTIDWCLGWPVPPPAYAPAPPRPPSGEYPDVPTLILSGELDTITTPAEGRIVDSQFPDATWVEIRGGLHVTALGDPDDCASVLVLTLVRTGHVGDTSCASTPPPLRTAPPFWATTSEATSGLGPAGGPRLDVAAVAVATAGDAVARWWQTYEVSGLGLRGGSWRSSGSETVTFRLVDYAFTKDVVVSGVVTWQRGTGAVAARFTITDSPSGTGTLTMTWD